MPKPFIIKHEDFTAEGEVSVEGQSIVEVAKPKGWKSPSDGFGIRICVLGTGIVDHDSLPMMINTINLGPSRNSLDQSGHSYAMSGIIGSHEGLKGFCPRCVMFSAKISNDKRRVKPNAVTSGILWGVATNADVIVLPIEGPSDNSMIKKALQKAKDRGAWVVAPKELDYENTIKAIDIKNKDIPTTLPSNRFGMVHAEKMSVAITAGILASYLGSLTILDRERLDFEAVCEYMESL